MKNNAQSKNRFPLSEKRPSEYPINSNEDAACVDIAKALGESNMRFILARLHQLGMQAISEAYAVVKEELRKGTCRNPRALFNYLLTKEWRERQERVNGDENRYYN